MYKTYFRCMVPSSRSALAVFAALFMATVLMLNPTAAFAQEAPNPFACYGIADEFNGDGTTDGLAIINRLDGTAEVIGGTGTAGIEALAFVPQDVNGTIQQVLFSVADPTNPNTTSSNTLGTVDITTGLWTPLDAAVQIGSGTDAAGTVFDFSVSGDIDGLTYDVQRDILWATQRNGGTGNVDYLLQLDPATGQIVPDAFGPGVDWVAVPLPDITQPDQADFQNAAGDPYDDIDDLAVDPVTGRVFIINNKGGSGGGLVELDPATGQPINYVGLFTGTTSADGIVDDMEGLAFFNDGALYGSTGNNGPDADDLNKLFVIDITTGATTFIGDFPDETRDIEALGCLTAPAFITLQKATNGEDADQPTGPTVSVGGPVTWTYEIKNTGAVPLINMTLSDDIEGDVSGRCEEGALPNPFEAGGTFTCTVIGVATTEGQYANVGTVNAVYLAPGDGGDVEVPLSAQDPSHYIGEAPTAAPDIMIVKTAGDAADGEVYTVSAPGPVTFIYTVTNTGNTYLTNITIVDDAGTPDPDTGDDVTLPTDFACDGLAGPLAPGDSVTCTAEIQVDGDATNVAETTGTPTDDQGTPIEGLTRPEDDDDAVVVIAPPLVPGISIIKTAGDAADGEVYTIPAAGNVEFTYVVENTGDTYLSDITIVDDLATPDDTNDDLSIDSSTCTGLIGPLAPGGTVTCTAQIQVTGDATNNAVTTGNPTDETGTDLPDLEDPIAEDPAIVDVAGPGISIVKTAGDAADGEVYTISEAGIVTFTYVVENTGETYLSDITITDDAGTPDDASDDVTLPTDFACDGLAGPVAPGDSVTCTAQIEVTDNATNIADTTGNPTDENGVDIPDAQDPMDNDPADVVVAIPGISIVKTAGNAADGDVYTISELGLVTFTYTVTNTGGTYLSDITIVDDAGTSEDPSDDVTLPTDFACDGLAGPLAPNASVTCSAQIQVNDDATNVATTTGNPTDENGVDIPDAPNPVADDPAIVEYAPGVPGISIVKTAGDAADGGVHTITETGLVTFTYVVQNIGTTYLSNITITDDAGTPDPETDDDVTLPTDFACDGLAGPLAPGGMVTCTAPIQVNGSITNTAGTTGTPTDENGNPLPGVEPPNDEDDAVVVLDPPVPAINIIKTAGDAADGEVFNINAPGIVTYYYIVTNIGETYLSDITITDDAGTETDLSDDVLITSTECADLAGPLAPGGIANCSVGLEVRGDVINNAGTTGNPTDENGTDLPGLENPEDDDDAEVDFVEGPGISIVKTAGDAADNSEYVINAPETVIYTYVVENTGNTYLTGITITDDAGTASDTSDDEVITSAECEELAGPLEPNGTVTCTLALPINTNTINNAGTTGTPSDPEGNPLDIAPPTDEDDAEVLLEAGPGIQLLKTVYEGHSAGAGCPDAGEMVTARSGSPVTYCFEVKNVGTTYLNNIVVNDPDLNIDRSNMTLLSGVEPLAPGDSIIFFYETTLDTMLLNTADTSGIPTDENGVPIPGLDPPTDDDTAEVIPLSMLGDIVWFDENANGVQDPDESGITGVTVLLYDENGEQIDSQVTDDNGNYGFVVSPGTYTLGFDASDLTGYYLSPFDVPTPDDATDSDANPDDDGRTTRTTISVGESDMRWDAGVFAPPILEIAKDDGGAVIQPNGTVIYSIVYSNTGVSDATGVVITERVPEYTTFSEALSTPGWVCEDNPTGDAPLCTFEIGRVEKGEVGRLTLTFVVFVDRFLPEDVSTINNIVTISDDGSRGDPPQGTFTDQLITPIFRPSNLNQVEEPGFSGNGTVNLYLPTVILQ